jgi:hydrogenase maturation protease
LLVGLGNPIMGDDAVGIQVVRTLKERMSDHNGVDFKELSLGGIKLVEEILGYDPVFIVDSFASPETAGKIREYSAEDFKDTEYASSPHSTNFATALEFYRKLEKEKIPNTIRIFTVDINPDFTFRESLSPAVQKAASELAELIRRELQKTQG